MTAKAKPRTTSLKCHRKTVRRQKQTPVPIEAALWWRKPSAMQLCLSACIGTLLLVAFL